MRPMIPRERGFLGFAELWADDHQFIALSSSRVLERYQRFRFDEIQAITITEMSHWTLAQLAWIVAGLLFAGTPVVLTSWWWGKAIWMPFVIWPLVFALREVARCPRCRVVVYTAAGSHLLRAVSRMNRVPAFLDAATPLLEAAQGRLESVNAGAHAPADQGARLRALEERLRPLRYTMLTLVGLGAILTMVSSFWPKIADRLNGIGFLHTLAEVIIASALWHRTSPLLRRTGSTLVSGVILGCIVLENLLGLAWLISRFPLGTGVETGDTFRALQAASTVWRVALVTWGIVELRRAALPAPGRAPSEETPA